MIINSVLSSTKDNSIQNNNHKKKILLNSKFPSQVNNNININNINTKIKYENENSSKPQKKKLILPNDAFYEGFINSNNEFEGYGEYRSPLYNYFGYFSCGKKNGKGKLEDFVRKLEYNGDFKENMKDGFGEEKYQDGSIYKGEFKKNMKNGKGNLILGGGNGFGYCGMFRDDKICGKGKFKWNENKEYIGDWEDDEINGYGIFREGKMRHVGFFEHNLKEGFGATFYVEQNFALLGKWEKDLIGGCAILINLLDNINSENININNEIIVGMNKGEITNMNLEEDELNKFKNNKDYEEMIKLFKEKFYLDYIHYTKDKSNS